MGKQIIKSSKHITLPKIVNVSVAGSLVMYDRLIKSAPPKEKITNKGDK